jgi:hypothetical protein
MTRLDLITLNIRRRIEVMKLLIMQFSPTSRHFISLRSKYSSQHPVLEHPPYNVSDQVSQARVCRPRALVSADMKKMTGHFTEQDGSIGNDPTASLSTRSTGK